ncbi:MAG TPA: hypothetical protein PLV00_07745 [Caldisericia bacterium]|nr:hypothetical protein [Thermotogota bacterium]HPJ13262.1 hypothetical protein [Caldisericia bacterium]HRW35913.1 hypothetical protein [Thermotogota bacterium]
MFLFGTIFIILSFLTGGITVYNFIKGEELNYFSLNANLLVGIFLAVLGIGFIVISKLEEIKWVLNNPKRSEKDIPDEADISMKESQESEARKPNDNKESPKWVRVVLSIFFIFVILFIIFLAISYI